MDFERPIHFDRESTQAWTNYYTKKSKHGSGLPGYRGEIYQRGDGLWDSIVKFGLPIIKYLGPKAANVMVSASSDALKGENFVKSLKKAGKAEAEGIIDDVVTTAKSKLTGRGRRRRKMKGGRKKRRVRKQIGLGRRRRRRSIRGRGLRKSRVLPLLSEALKRYTKLK